VGDHLAHASYGWHAIFRGHSSAKQEQTRDMRQVEGANPSVLTIFCPCGVAQSTRLPLMPEITGAKPVRDANFDRPQSIVSDALAG
jgi:hypothetical protein